MISLFLAVISIFLYLRKNYFPSLLIFFFLLMDGFQVIPIKILTAGSFSGATSDSALFLFFVLFVFRGRIWLSYPSVKSSFAKWVFLFIGIIILNSFYGLFVQDYSAGDVFKGCRLYFFVLSFLMFTEVPLPVMLKLIKVLIVITFIQAILFVLQIVTGHSILQGADELEDEDLSYTRFYNAPKFIDFAMAVMLFWNPFKKNKWIKWIMIFVFSCTIVGPLDRGYLFAWFFAIGLVSILFNRLDKKIFYIISIVITGFVVLSITLVQKRIDQAIDELSVLESISQGHAILEDNTFTYRIQHLTERVDYIASQPMGWLFGIGLVDEGAPQVNRLPFKYGLPDPITGRIAKVYTPDISWSMLFLTMGFVGTFIYIMIFIRIIFQFSRSKVIPEVSKILFVLIVLGLIVSVTSNNLTLPTFYVPILLLVMVIEKKALQKNNKINKTYNIRYDNKPIGINYNSNLQ